MISRRLFCILLFLCVSSFGVHPKGIAQDANTTLTADVLSKTLYALTSSDVQYCKDVIKARDSGELPNRLLYSSYKYAMKQPKDRRMIYFQLTLEKLCKKESIILTFTTAKSTSNTYKPSSPFSFSSVSANLSSFRSYFQSPRAKYN